MKDSMEIIPGTHVSPYYLHEAAPSLDEREVLETVHEAPKHLTSADIREQLEEEGWSYERVDSALGRAVRKGFLNVRSHPTRRGRALL